MVHNALYAVRNTERGYFWSFDNDDWLYNLEPSCLIKNKFAAEAKAINSTRRCEVCVVKLKIVQTYKATEMETSNG